MTTRRPARGASPSTLLSSDALVSSEAILHFAANSVDIAIIHKIDVRVAHDLVLFDRSLQVDIMRKPHRQCAKFKTAHGRNCFRPNRKSALAIEHFARLHILLGGGDSVSPEFFRGPGRLAS